ncbi:MAG TPA: 2Fe-2S iron-sulfur cluster-binding protein [Steroidobacteraceae bacterium]|nr:2Fe-2S iron-sulfur cluster-binding protein [Steroidobacteraceae bacterium]
MSGPYRLPTFPGASLDRQHTLRFRFNGRELTGYAGDTLASALLANGVRTVGRSLKFHRPRGVYSSGVEEPNALLRLSSGVRAIPSARATLTELHDGLESYTQSGWPSVTTDFARVLDFTAPLWAAGFYNKTFMWPSWHTYEWAVRRMAGLGHAPPGRDPDRYDTRNIHCDVLIVGGGAAGLREAEAAAAAGQRVVLAEQGPSLGGRGAWNGANIEGQAGHSWAARLVEGLRGRPDVQLLTRTTAVGYYDRDVVTLLERVPVDGARGSRSERPNDGGPRERYWVVRAGRMVLAGGALEQPLVFCNNDRPGVVLAGAAHEYLRRYSVAVGRRVIVATNNDSAYKVAGDLRDAGVEVVALADSRKDVAEALLGEMRSRSIPVLLESLPIDTSGFSTLNGVTIGRLSRDGATVVGEQRFACDALAVSGGWAPLLHLYSQAGGKLRYSSRTGALEPVSSHPRVTLAGSAAGEKTSLGPRVSPAGDTLRKWVDLRHDVTVADLELAIRENYSSIEHVKRYTTVGMSVDQGKTSNVAAIEIVAKLRGVSPEALGHTTLRPPFTPVTLGAIAGRSVGDGFAPSRLLPLHDWHVSHGGLLEDYGEWKRPAAYIRQGESRAEAIRREMRAARTAAALFDGSPLGKIEIQGPDALAFIDKFYINNLATLQPGRARYGLMLRESGVIFDDGTVVLLAPDHVLITTTSANASRVGAWLEEWHQCEWPDMRVVITSVTDQWATISLAGGRAREILSRLDTDIDLSPTAFPHLGTRVGHLLGHVARIYRVSFTGELTYEINVPASAAGMIWSALLQAGEPLGLQPMGIEALLALRLEKGFLHVGTDTDGTSVPDDVGWGKAAASKRADFVGKRSLLMPENRRTGRLQLVGLRGVGATEIIVGSHLRLSGSGEATDGWVTSAGRLSSSGEPIALALLRGGRDRLGSEVSVHDEGRVTQARVAEPIFFDAAGERMNG